MILIKGIDSRKNGGKSKKPPVVSSGSYWLHSWKLISVVYKYFWFIEKSLSDVTPQYTAAEIALYERHLEEGYDVTTDAKYNAWLKFQDTASKLH